MIDPSAFGVWLKAQRKHLDLTQDELARRVGCAAESIRKIEAGVQRPSKQIAERLADCLAIPEDKRAEFVRLARAIHTVRDSDVVGDLQPRVDGRTSGTPSEQHTQPNGIGVVTVEDRGPAGVQIQNTRPTHVLREGKRGASTALFGELLRARRAALDLTRAELAGRVGCSTELIRRIEAGTRRPSKQVAARLAASLAIPEGEWAAFVAAARGVAAPSARLGPPGLTQRRHNLPAALTPLIGRERELGELRALLARKDVRLITLTGAGGSGKTHLALEVATEQVSNWPDGIWFVDLAPLRAPDQVALAIAQTLGIVERSDQPLAQTLAAFLRVRQLLLVLDNYEHLLDAAPLAAELLHAAPDIAILATSRVRLRLTGEHLYPVPPLALPDPAQAASLAALASVASVQLFLARAQAVQPDCALTEANASTVGAICTRLNGLPLAIELAAVRLPFFGFSALLARLDQVLPLLVDGPRDLPTRQHTLRATIAWSFDLLSPTSQTLLVRLGIFAGGWTLEQAKAVCGGSDATLDVEVSMAELLEHQLARRVEDMGGEGRFTMLELVREFAEERLDQRGERAMMEVRRATAILALAQRLVQQLDGDAPLPALAQLDAELGNLRAVLAWAEQPNGSADIGLCLAVTLVFYWRDRGLLQEGFEWALRLLRHPVVQVPTTLRARALCLTANLTAYNLADHTQALALADEGLGLARAFSDAPTIAWALQAKGWSLTMQGDIVAARQALQEALSGFRALGNSHQSANTLFYLARVFESERDLARARACYAEAQALYCALGDRRRANWIRNGLSWLALCEGDLVSAVRLMQEALVGARALGTPENITMHLRNLGDMLLDVEDPAQAMTAFTEALTINEGLGEPVGIAENLVGVADVLFAQGDVAGAQARYGVALRLLQEYRHLAGIGIALRNLARGAHAQGDWLQARTLLNESLALFVKSQNRNDLIATLNILSSFCQAEGRHERAVLFIAASHALTPYGNSQDEHSLALARTTLSDEGYAATWATGAAMTADEALVAARDELRHRAAARSTV